MSIFKKTSSESITKLSATTNNHPNYGAAGSSSSNVTLNIQHDTIDKNNDDIVEIMSNSKDDDQEECTRLVPGGKMPKAQGKKMINHLLSVVFMLLIQIGIPLSLYYGLRNRIGVVYALVISGLPSFLHVIYGFIRKGQIEILGCIITVSFVLSAIVSIVSGDERAALIRDSSVGAIVGCMFMVTLIPIRNRYVELRPLTFIMAEQMYANVKYQWTDSEGNLQEQNITRWQWDHVRYFRINMYTQSACWGILLILQLVICALMVWNGVSTDEVVLYNNIISLTVTCSMITASIIAGIYGIKQEKKVGKKWTEENDFTGKFKRQQQQGEDNV